LQAQPETGLEAPSINFWFAQGGTTSKFVEGKGTITTSTANVSCTGTGSSFLAQVSQGDIIYGPTYQLVGTVAGVASTTSLSFVSNSAVTLSSQNYYITSSKNYTVYFGDPDASAPQAGFCGIATTAPSLAISSGTAVSSITAGQIVTFDGTPRIQINYTNTYRFPQLNWYCAIEVEAREKRRQSG
jgi:hypothetical protein